VSSSSTELIDVVMPQMGVSVSEGTVVEWKKAVGENVDRDEIICAISTDKIDTDLESPGAGVVREILVDVGETVDVGTVLARIEGEGGGVPTGEAAAAVGDTPAPSVSDPAPVVRSNGGYRIDGDTSPFSINSPQALFNVVTPGYFQTLGVAVRRGRDLAKFSAVRPCYADRFSLTY